MKDEKPGKLQHPNESECRLQSPLYQRTLEGLSHSDIFQARESEAQLPQLASTSQAIYGTQPSLIPDMNIACESNPLEALGTDFYGDPLLWDFMDTQPMLQWLDSDFSALGDAWMVTGNEFPSK